MPETTADARDRLAETVQRLRSERLEAERERMLARLADYYRSEHDLRNFDHAANPH